MIGDLEALRFPDWRPVLGSGEYAAHGWSGVGLGHRTGYEEAPAVGGVTPAPGSKPLSPLGHSYERTGGVSTRERSGGVNIPQPADGLSPFSDSART